MRKFLTFCIVVLMATVSYGQTPQRLIDRDNLRPLQALPEVPSIQDAEQVSPNVTPGPVVPIGATTTNGSAVTAIKIGESSNTFTNIVLETNQISYYPLAGSNGGSLSFIYRQNIGTCFGSTGANGEYRYSISTNGGSTWDIDNQGVIVPPNPPATQCYGKGVLNPAFSFPSRYPNAQLFAPGQSTDVSDLHVAYSGPVLNGSWDGLIVGLAGNVAGNPTLAQEQYLYQSGNTYFSYSLVHQYDSRSGLDNFWFLSRTYPNATVGETFLLHKGVLDTLTGRINFSIVRAFSLPYSRTFDGSGRAASAQIAFSPDGSVGYIAMVGDLVGGTDSVYSPIVIESTDYGDNWGNAEEINLNAYPDLIDAVNLNFVDVTPAGDTVQFTQEVTTGFSIDLEVDSTGTPHMLIVAGVGGTATTPPAYSIFSGVNLEIFNVTRDPFGDWNAMFISDQGSFRGTYGDATNNFTEDPYVQVTRSVDGSKIFFTWNDTDTTGGGGTDNSNPDLVGRAYDVATGLLTPVENFTSNDPDWAARVINPKTSSMAIKRGTTYSVPTVVASLVGGNTLAQTDFWYFTDVDFEESDFTQTASFFRNCKQDPIVLANPTINAAACGGSDGSITVTPNGGRAPYTYDWSSGDATATASNLAAGLYTVTVTDSFGCEATETFALNNTNAPTVTIGTVVDITCAGLANGSATATATGGTGTLSYAWSPSGEIGATANQLAAGVNTVLVTDASGCQSRATVTVNEPEAISLTLAPTDIRCFGSDDGRARVIQASGGTGTLTYIWDDQGTPMPDPNREGLSAGTYILTVNDLNGCTATDTVTIAEPAALVVDSFIVRDPGSGMSDGAIFVQPDGGTAPYSYDWGAYASTSDSLTNVVCGTYAVQITDANGCTTNDSIHIGPGNPIGLALDVTNISCNGEIDGMVVPNASGGFGTFSFLYSGGTSDNLAAGTYTVTATDGLGCERRADFTITEPPALSVVIQTVPGGATATVTGGTAPYSYDWGGASNLDTATISGSAGGTFAVTITDANGCEFSDIVDIPVSIDPTNGTFKSLSVFPNPSSDRFTLRMELRQRETASLQVFDTRGRVVVQRDLGAAQRFEETISLGELSQGIYILRVSTAKGSANVRLVRD